MSNDTGNVERGGPGYYPLPQRQGIRLSRADVGGTGYAVGRRPFTYKGQSGWLVTKEMRGGPGNYPYPVFTFYPN